MEEEEEEEEEGLYLRIETHGAGVDGGCLFSMRYHRFFNLGCGAPWGGFILSVSRDMLRWRESKSHHD